MQRLADGGPLYAETDLSQWIKEPWNALSAFFFVALVVFWIYRLRGNYKTHPFLSWMVPLLAIGGVGGTLYHAFRVSQFFLLMDWVPIMLICAFSSMYFLIEVVGKKRYATALLVIAFFIQFLTFQLIPDPIAINVSYALWGLLVLVPSFLYMHKHNFYAAHFVGFALLSFLFALGFRIADPWGWLPMGTHFLWHSFGALTCHLMFLYLYHVNEWKFQKADSSIMTY